MRSLIAVQVVSDDAGTITMVGLDDDGYLWLGHTRSDRKQYTEGKVLDADWKAIRGPGDAPPFLDTRTRLDRLEASIREQTEERDALRKHFESLPKIGADPEEDSAT